MQSKKVCIWTRDGKVTRQGVFDIDEATMATEDEDVTIVVFDENGRIETVDAYAKGIGETVWFVTPTWGFVSEVSGHGCSDIFYEER